MGALHAVRDRGFIPGRDIAVVGFDDSPRHGARLTSVRQPIEEVGRLVMAEMLRLTGRTSVRTVSRPRSPCIGS
ncbi:hypothetical protein E4K10_00080 [Streptomyces sp. T1317-0309]|nr:hypothetical protein E4K10_00080 [Streptomyces sp. T1317-0309]